MKRTLFLVAVVFACYLVFFRVSNSIRDSERLTNEIQTTTKMWEVSKSPFSMPADIGELIDKKGVNFSPDPDQGLLEFSLRQCWVAGVKRAVRDGVQKSYNVRGFDVSPWQWMFGNRSCNQHLPIFRELSAAGLSLNDLGKAGKANALHIALHENVDATMALVLINAGADVNQVDDQGMIPIQHADFGWDPAMQLVMLNRGAGKGRPGSLDQLFIWSIYQKNQGLAAATVQNGANPNVKLGALASTPLAWAELNDFTLLAAALRRNGARR